MSHILTFDLGTSYFKAALFDEQGQLCHLARVAPPIIHPTPGRWELPADHFRQVIEQTIDQLRRDAGSLSTVRAISFATQTNSFVLLDQHDQPLTPLIFWPDDRATDFNPADLPALNTPDFYATTGVPALSKQFMLAKLLWLQAHAPDIYNQTRRLCLLSDYLTLWLTGHHLTEAGVAGLTGLVNIHDLNWSPQANAILQLPPSAFPPIARAATNLGPIRPAIAEHLGLPHDCQYIVGCLDQYAGAIGAGNVTADSISETTGTVLATVRCASNFDNHPGPGAFQGPAFQSGTYFAMVFGDTSARLLEEYRRRQPDDPSFDQLVDQAATVPPGSAGLTLRTDAHWQHDADLFHGRTPQHNRGHEVRAILEAVAFALRDQIMQLCKQHHPTEIRSVGGAAKSPLWLQVKADVLGRPVLAIDCPEPTSLGAAILAQHGLTGQSIAQIALRFVRPGRMFSPDPANHALYTALDSPA